MYSDLRSGAAPANVGNRQTGGRRGAAPKRAAGCRRSRAFSPGFTLLELMVVIVIIGLLAGAVTIGVRGYLVAGKQSVAKMEIAEVCQALETFYAAYDRYPSNDEGLDILTQPGAKFVSGLLSKVPVDPWGNPYQYNQPGRNGAYEVICYGADGREGGEHADADITSEELGRRGD